MELVVLIGPANYVKYLSTVANETYPTYLTQGEPIIVTGIAGARTLTFEQ